METLLKIKVLQEYTKDAIVDPKDGQLKYTIDKKKYEDVGVITTYIFREINFHTSWNNYPHQVWEKNEDFAQQD